MKFKKYNMHGALLCAAFKCRKHTKLQYVEHDWFCPLHAKEISSIRHELREVKGNPYKILREIELRRKELWFRQCTDKGHYYYLLKLVRLLI